MGALAESSWHGFAFGLLALNLDLREAPRADGTAGRSRTQIKTIVSTSGPKCEWPTSAPRIPSTP